MKRGGGRPGLCWRRLLFALSGALLLAQIAGCAGKQTPPLPLPDDGARDSAPLQDPAGPIPSPSPPPGLSGGAPDAPSTPDARPSAIVYTVECTVEDEAKDAPARPAPRDAAKGPDPPSGSALTDAFRKSSQISRLADKPPKTLIALEQRLRASFGEGRDILNSHGYYAGTVHGWLEPAGKGEDANNILVRVHFVPGRRYSMGATRVREDRPPGGERAAPGEGAPLPTSLEEVGLARGAPAVAADVLAAVERVLDLYRDNGYPFAAIASSRYTVDHEQKSLEADLLVTPGDFVRMGEIERHGAPTVGDDYVKTRRAWKPGQAWSRSRVEEFQDALRQSGLFQSIEARPADKPGPGGRRDVVVTLASAPERTVGGALKHHSDFGPGLQAYWEHRNLTGRGDIFRVEAPLWADMQELTASYRLPHFLRGDQSFIARAGVLNQELEAYSLQSAAASAGVERRFSSKWSGSAMISAEGGSIKEPGTLRREYVMYGLPLGLTYNTADSPLDATKGTRLLLSLTPYNGEFGGPFTVLRSRADGHAFFPLVGKDSLVLAMRGVLGAVAGASASQIPPSARFYSGGGGSVRGYDYQSLGPRDKDQKPLGGNALTEASTELRWKVTREWGLVGFIDGGTAVDEPLQRPNLDMRWGAGIGLRYYTAIGPVRVDVATPLNPREDDAPLQFYISIGQNF